MAQNKPKINQANSNRHRPKIASNASQSRISKNFIYSKRDVNDTVYIKDTVVTAEILTSHPWKIQEIRGVDQGSILYYLRGGTTNTTNYDNEYITFSANQNGFEVDNAGITHQISNWNLSGTQIVKLTCTYHVNSSNTMVLTWDNLRFKNNTLYYDEYYSNPVVGNNFHGQGIRITK